MLAVLQNRERHCCGVLRGHCLPLLGCRLWQDSLQPFGGAGSLLAIYGLMPAQMPASKSTSFVTSTIPTVAGCHGDRQYPSLYNWDGLLNKHDLEELLPWEERTGTLIFRGASTGGHYNARSGGSIATGLRRNSGILQAWISSLLIICSATACVHN